MAITSTDPISDMLTRIRNAALVCKNEIVLPHSKMKEAVAKLLVESNFVDNVTVAEASVGKALKITINAADANSRITEIVRLSKPGRRQYVSVDGIPVVKRGRGVVIVSTSQGLMTGDDARAKHLGGELICKVY